MTIEITTIARRQLAESGSAGLSLRAVAREMGMVSSALYRYFASRDDLLTALIVDAYTAVGAAAEAAEADVRRTDLAGRWQATCRAVREWAVASPHEYALIFGSPVPGYRAPEDTVDPAARIPLLLLQIMADAVAAGLGPEPTAPVARTVRPNLSRLAMQVAPTLNEAQLAVALMAWTQLIGSISFELFGHLNNVISDYPGYFEFQMRRIAVTLGLFSDGAITD
jgi:AcrR family transcriptional regulator